MDQGAPLALIVNQFLSNSFKYAFPEPASRRITVSARRYQNTVEVVVADDGIGAPGDAVPSGGLGSTLVQAFTGQLKGRIERRAANGTTIVATFPLQSD